MKTETTSAVLLDLVRQFHLHRTGHAALSAAEMRTFQAHLKECVAEVELLEQAASSEFGARPRCGVNDNRPRRNGNGSGGAA